ncbi:MAG: hypothetical protein RRZ68_07550 [Oscillospiraceae bacterium]
MKKIITAILAISVLTAMSTTAFAADINQGSTDKSSNTEVTFNVAPTYIVTIPTAIELTETKTGVITYTGSDTITTSAIRLNKGEKVKIAIASDFTMTSTKNATQSYTVTVDGATSSLVNGGEVARFGTNKAAQSVKLNYLAGDPEFAGDYKDTVTFTLSVVE